MPATLPAQPLPASSQHPTLPAKTLLKGFGGALTAYGRVVQPRSVDEIRSWLAYAREHGLHVTQRGAGQSYGDANIGDELVLDFSRMNKILSFDRETGVLVAEPGVTVQDAWEFGVELGFWPPVVSGTMKPTLGGALAMNIHGKNHYKSGSLGDHVLSFKFLDAAGQEYTCSRDENADLFFAVIGSAGLLGVFTEITLRLKHVYSGNVVVDEEYGNNLDEIFRLFESYEGRYEYVVGWLDGHARGASLGRGAIHAAQLLPKGYDPQPELSLALERQILPPYLMGVFPKAWMWFFFQFFNFQLGMRFVNFGKFWATRLTGSKRYLQSHAGFHFLLDYVPNWNKAYGKGGLIQYQAFVPKETAQRVFADLFRLQQEWGLVANLLVMKRHRADQFLFSSNLDGYSMAMDFAVSEANRVKLWALAAHMDEIILAGGGRFYLAKDGTLRAGQLERAYGSPAIRRFWEFKRRLDPQGTFRTRQSQRLRELSVAPE